MTKEHILYRYWCKGELLYIGRTADMGRRHSAHMLRSKWWPVADAITLERFDTLDDLVRAEERAIQIERPPFNVEHSTLSPAARHERQQKFSEAMASKAVTEAEADAAMTEALSMLGEIGAGWARSPQARARRRATRPVVD